MPLTLDQLKDAAADLPLSERTELAQFLLSRIDDAEAAEVRAEWVALAERRMAEVKAGRVIGIPADEVVRTLLEPKP